MAGPIRFPFQNLVIAQAGQMPPWQREVVDYLADHPYLFLVIGLGASLWLFGAIWAPRYLIT
jgi:hypothetical protein